MTTKMTRRQWLRNAGIVSGLAAAELALPEWMPRLAFAQPYNDPKGDVLISIFLRGGADSLNMIVPFAEDAYYAARPRLAIARPDASDDNRLLNLDGFFGLHPALGALLPIFQGGQMLAVHATGSPHETRSHFEAMDFMERGEIGDYTMTSGWIARHLASLDVENPSPMRGIGWGTALQQSLVGAPSTIAMQSIIDYHLGGDAQLAEQMMQSLMGLYQLETESLLETAESTHAAISVVQSVGYDNYLPQNGAEYPQTPFAMALRQTAALIRADAGLEASCIDLGGWDTHANQGTTSGTQSNLMTQLAQGLAAFHQDMGTDMSKVTVVIMSEFGRRVEENGSRGTDHGHGGAMLLMSGGLNADVPVFAEWPTLAPDKLDNGDLAITIDYRDVLSEVVSKRLKNPALDQVFPGYVASSRELLAT
ncbi:MAG: DUF1501 domain-containing protein [Anaerolineae bacterium]|nr:DUF1501 domain-containing protein [Anaerolineae bacterium]